MRKRRILLIAGIGVAITGAVAPLVTDQYTIDSILDFFLIYVILSQSYDLLGGFMGYVNLGITVFFASSAYVFAILFFYFHWTPVGAFIVGGLFSAALGFLISFPMFRLRGFYFAVATLALVELGYYIVYSPLAEKNWYTGGVGGINFVSANYYEAYYSILALAVGVVMLIYFISRSKFGLALRSIREDEQIAEASGINTRRIKRIALIISATLSGLTGCLYAWSQGSVLPDTVFGFNMALLPVTFALFGGTGTVIGPIIGSGVYSVIDAVLKSNFVTSSAYGSISSYEFAIVGAFLVFVGLFAPDGILGLSRRVYRRIRTKRSTGQMAKPAVIV